MTSRVSTPAYRFDVDPGSIHILTDGTRVRLAPLNREDRKDLLDGFQGLSGESRYLRFFSAMPRLTPAILEGLLATDGVWHVAVCARRVAADGATLGPIVGVARYFRSRSEPTVAEPAVAVIDELHQRGLGRLLLRALGRHARASGIERYRAHALATNERITQLLNASQGVIVERDGPVVVYDVDIRPRPRTQRPRRRLRDLLRAMLRSGG